MSVRTRFAPSPTGYLHIGGVRTALFNWLFARQHGGQFILRIDDTDQQRNVEAALLPILNGFQWLGIDWDEGPTPDGKSSQGPHGSYFQSQRSEQHRAAVAKLLASGHAYRDYARTEELQAEREAAEKEKRTFTYSRRWMAETAEQAAQFEAEGRQAVVRLKMPREGKLVIPDLIRGDVEFNWADEQDHVIQRADGTCLYHLASVVDDYDFQITHVIRAEEHLSNTPRQIFIAQSLGYQLPQYAHLPYVAEPGSKNKLSKRKLDKYLKNKDFAAVHEHGQAIRITAEKFKNYSESYKFTFASLFKDLIRIIKKDAKGNTINANLEKFTQIIESLFNTPNTPIYQEFAHECAEFLAVDVLEIYDNEHLIELFNHGLQLVKHLPKVSPETFNPVIVDFYEQVGYLPHAIINYLVLLGWSLDGTTEFFTIEEMIKHFSLERINKAPASFDPKKLMAFQEHYFKQLPAKQKCPRMIDYLQRAGLASKPVDCELGPYLVRIIEAAGDRIKVFGDILNFSEFFVTDEQITIPGDVREKHLTPGSQDLLRGFADVLKTVEPFEVGPLETALQAFVAARGIKVGELIHPLRLALCGKTVGMGLYDTLAILGREKCLKRIGRVV